MLKAMTDEETALVMAYLPQMPADIRLLISLVATTGMGPREAISIEHERDLVHRL